MKAVKVKPARYYLTPWAEQRVAATVRNRAFRSRPWHKIVLQQKLDNPMEVMIWLLAENDHSYQIYLHENGLD